MKRRSALLIIREMQIKTTMRYHLTQVRISSVQFNLSVMSNSLQPHGLQHASSSRSSSFPKVCLNSSLLCQWFHPVFSSSDALFSFCPQSFPGSGTFPISWLFTSDDQNTGASASASVIPMSIQGWYPLGWTGLISLLSKRLSGVFFSTTYFAFCINYFAFCFLYCPAFTTIRDHWEDHSLYYMDLCRQSNVSAFQHTPGLS